jgi:hypothetical protein
MVRSTAGKVDFQVAYTTSHRITISGTPRFWCRIYRHIYAYINRWICKYSNCFILVILSFDTEHLLRKHLEKFFAFTFFSSLLKASFMKLTPLFVVHVGYIHRFALSVNISPVFTYHIRNKYCADVPLLTNNHEYQQTCPYIQLSIVVRKGQNYDGKNKMRTTKRFERGAKILNIERTKLTSFLLTQNLFLYSVFIHKSDYRFPIRSLHHLHICRRNTSYFFLQYVLRFRSQILWSHMALRHFV